MNILEAIESRASAAKLTEPAPSREVLDRILLAGARAPDHGRLRPFRFVVLHGDDRLTLGNAMADIRRRKSPDATERDLESERNKVMRAPLIVVVAAHVVSGHKVPEIEQVLAVAAGVENMILAAQALGFGSLWKTGAGAYDENVKRALGLDPADSIVAFLYLGTASVAGVARAVTLDGLVVTAAP